MDDFFRTRYYSAIREIHERIGEEKLVTVFTDLNSKATLAAIIALLRKRKLIK
jgi:hypothetical protein